MANLTHLRDKVNNREIDVQQSQKSLTSKQLENVSPESGSYQEKPFLFQGTGTDSNTTETPTAPIAKHLELRGNTVVFNQLIDTNTTTVDTISGHKYLTLISGVKSIITSAGETLNVTSATDMVIDLTKMFGSGKEPTSVVQFNRLFPLPYYAYNAGELKSCQSNKLITTGYNQFETLNQFIRVVAGQTYRLMYWNGTALAALTSGSIEEYDGAQTLIQTTTYDNLSDLHTVDNSYPDNGDKGIKLTDETQYVKIVNSNNTNILFNLAWDGSRSDYEAYVKHEYALPNVELKSAGNAYDSHYPDGTHIQRVASIDLGTCDVYDYQHTETIGRYRIPIPGMKRPISNNKTWLYINCVEYNVNNTEYSVQLSDMNICVISGVSNIYIRNDNYLTAEAMKIALSGVILYYELETPIETTGQTFAENANVDDMGTMEFTTSGTESASNPIIPQGNKFFYPADYALLIDDLNNYTDGDVNSLAKKSDLPQILYGTTTPTTATVGTFGQIYIDTATNKVYQCTAVTAQGTTPETYEYTWVDLTGGGGEMLIKLAGVAQTPDAQGYVDIPQCDGVIVAGQGPHNTGATKPALLSTDQSGGFKYYGDGSKYTLRLAVPTNTLINNRNTLAPHTGGATALNLSYIDYAVKAAMTDGDGAAWTDVERLAALLRMGCTVDENGFVKWTATPQGE